MKTYLRYLPVIALFAFASCSKDDDNSTSSTTPPAGQWFIHYYWDEKDETNDFSGYTFEFLTNGQVKATKAGTTVTGSWQETTSEFIINFGTDPVLQEINDDWQKIEKTSSFLHLEDDNPAQDDELHFKKL
jgi:hypothetical protein